MNRAFLNLIFLIIACLAVSACDQMPLINGGNATKTYRVGIMQQTTHPAVDAARDGIKQAFADAGLQVTFSEKNAQNDVPALKTIAQGFRDEKVDMVISIGTLPTQAAYEILKESGIPLVFTAVVDPYQAGVARSETDHPGIAGIQALPPVTEAFDLIPKIKLNAKRVGTIWTPAEKNSEVFTQIARDHAQSMNMEFIERQVTKADEVADAAKALADSRVDAIFIGTDSTVVSELGAIVKIAIERKIALVCADPASAARGCTVALGLDYFENGYQSAKQMAIPILKGEQTTDAIPIGRATTTMIAINAEATQVQGVILPDDVRLRAKQVFDTIAP